MTRYTEKPLDLDEITEKWLKLCGACDVGIGECNHPDGDYRPVMASLVLEISRLRARGVLPLGTQTCTEMGVALTSGVSMCGTGCDQADHTPDRRRFIHTTPWEAISDVDGGGS